MLSVLSNVVVLLMMVLGLVAHIHGEKRIAFECIELVSLLLLIDIRVRQSEGDSLG